MSEPLSLYVKLKITKEKLDQFFLQCPLPLKVDAEWQQWWDGREMYNKEELRELPAYGSPNYRTVIQELLDEPRFAAAESYDETTQTWTLLVLYFSENYTESLPMLSLLKHLGSDVKGGDDNVALLYDFLWGNGSVMAYIEYTGQRAVLTNYSETAELAPAVMAAADAALEALCQRLQAAE